MEKKQEKEELTSKEEENLDKITNKLLVVKKYLYLYT